MPLRLLIYKTRIWEAFLKEHPGERLPVILSFVLAQNASRWEVAQQFSSLLDLPKEEAELFLNFILRPDISAELTNEFQFICANKAAVEYLDDDLKNSPLCVLTDDMKKRIFMINTFDADAISAETDAVMEIKSSR